MPRFATLSLAALLALLAFVPVVTAQNAEAVLPSDPTRTRTVLAPTARTLGRGETRLGTTFYLFPSVTHGVSDRIDVYGSGFVIVSDGGGGFASVGAKGTLVDRPGLGVAIGTTLVVPFASGPGVNGSIAALPYGVVTIGDNARSVSLGITGAIGADVTNGNYDVGDAVAVSLAGETQISRRVKLLADVIVPVGAGEPSVLILPGLRFFGRNVSVDLYGAAVFVGSDFGGFAPLANFSYRF